MAQWVQFAPTESVQYWFGVSSKSDKIKEELRVPQNKAVRCVNKLNPLINTKAVLHFNIFAAVSKKETILSAQQENCRGENVGREIWYCSSW